MTGSLITFAGVAFLVFAVPGPSVVYVVARSMEWGRRAGLWSMIGLEAGLCVHVCASTAGLSAAVAASGTAYDLLRLAGAAYLAWLGIGQLVPAPGSSADPCAPDGPGAAPVLASTGPTAGRLVRDGFLVDVLNPKTGLFFLAFLPQFIDTAGPPPTVQLLALGLVAVPLAAMCDGTYALVAGGLRGRLLGSARSQRWVTRCTGTVYLLLAGSALAL